MLRTISAALLAAAALTTAAHATTAYHGPLGPIFILPDVNPGQTLFVDLELNEALEPGNLMYMEALLLLNTGWYEHEYIDGELVYSHSESELLSIYEVCLFNGPKDCQVSFMKTSFDGKVFKAIIRNSYPSIDQSIPCPDPMGYNTSGSCEYYSQGILPYMMFGSFGQELSGQIRYRYAGEVPEPSTWAMMILGFGAVGFTARRRRPTAA